MKYAKILVSSLALMVLAAFSLQAQVDIISADEFMDLYKSNKELVVVDGNKAKNYAANHIKGAVNIYHMDLYKDGEISGLILEPEELAALFGEQGISETTPVVVYDDGSQKYNSRIYWILKYLGAENVKVLHKDMDTWRAARIPLTSQPTTLKAVTFTPTVNPDLIATTEYVRDRKDAEAVVLIDARTADEYNGVDKSDGHIPGAININFEDFATETGAFKNAEELTAMLSEKGVTPDKEILVYCKTSVRATPIFVALTNILGYENVRVYDGAYSEWIVNNPVVQ